MVAGRILLVTGLAALAFLVARPADPAPAAARKTLIVQPVPDRSAAIDQAISLLDASIDPANATSIYNAYSIGVPIIMATFTSGNDAAKSRILRQFAARIERLPTYGAVVDRAASEAPLTDNPALPEEVRTRLGSGSRFDGLPLPTDRRMRGFRIFPLRDGNHYQLNTGNIQQHGYLIAMLVRQAAQDSAFLRRQPAAARDLDRIARFAAHDIVRFYWEAAPAWHWAGPYPNMRARSRARLASAPELAPRRFFRAFLDYDVHIFAAAAELSHAQYVRPGLLADASDRAAVADAYATGRQVLIARVDTGPNGQGFAFDRGLWDDNPVAQYGGCQDRRLPVRPCPLTGYTMDISHAQRWPVWLQSFAVAEREPAMQQRIAQWRINLGRQFASQVLRYRDGRPILRNFLDGRDGWFLTTESRNGRNASPPSSLTGWSMRHGSWALLDDVDPRIGQAQRRFCAVITSTAAADIAFRTRYYGQPESHPANGVQPASDEFGPSSIYSAICAMLEISMAPPRA